MSKPAILGGDPIRTKAWPRWPEFGKEEKQSVSEVLESGKWWRFAGHQVLDFEKAFAEYHDGRHALAVANGTVSLEISLRSSGIGPGDEVLVPAYTYIASASAPIFANAATVFVDVDIKTYNIDIEDLKRKITPRTRAIIPVHFAGYPADMDAIMEIAKKHNLVVIEDAAHAHGAVWKGRKLGAVGHAGSFSFQESKNLCSGEGGLILTDDKDLWTRCYSMANFGRAPGAQRYCHTTLGTNARLNEFAAAILIHGLKRLEEQSIVRHKNGQALTKLLKGIPGIEVIDPLDDSRVTRRAYHLYMFRYDKNQFKGLSREQFCKALNAEGVPCLTGYEFPLYKNPAFTDTKFPSHHGIKDYRAEQHCPVSEKICTETIWMTQNLFLGKESDMQDIQRAILKISENAESLHSCK